MIYKSKVAFIAAASALCALAGAQTITTYPAWNGTDWIEEFGVPDTATYGQTFKASGSLLKSYSSSFSNPYGNTGFQFKFYIGAWDGTKMSGGPLFSSGPYTSTSITSGFELLKVDTNLLLTPGSSYVAFYSISEIPQKSPGTIVQASSLSNAYADGEFVYQNNRFDFNSLSTQDWYVYGGGYDIAFKAEFESKTQAVPEPFTMGLLGMGALVARKRMKKS